MRMIDADYLKEHLEACAINGRPLHRMYSELQELLDAIDDVPTIEPEQHWIPCSKRLPHENEWVLGTVDYVHDGLDAPKRVVVKLRKGISVEERKKLREEGNPRAYVWELYDEGSNNLKPYAWETWGSMKYYGQEITAWMPLPEPWREEDT